jgi:hypothetical protein
MTARYGLFGFEQRSQAVSITHRFDLLLIWHMRRSAGRNAKSQASVFAYLIRAESINS